MSEPDDRHDDELARMLRASLHRNAEHAPDPTTLTDRTLARLGERSTPATRRWRRAGAPLIAAASVAAVVAAGLIGTAIVHQRHERAQAAAASSRSAQLMHSQTRQVLPPLDRTPSRATSTPSVSPTAEALPSGFRVRDLSFLGGGSTSYAIGRICPGDRCADSVVATSSDGADWTVVSRPPFTVGSGGVTSVRFVTSEIGYAYGPSVIYRTGDGGYTWSQMDSGGAVALETANTTAVRLTASSADCTSGCRYSVSLSEVSGDAWKQAALPRAATGTKAFLVRTDHDVYVATADGSTTTLFYSADDGVSWNQQSSAPCAGDFGSPSGTTLTALASAQDGAVVALCAGRTSASVQVSTDHGAQFSMPAHNAPATVATAGTPAVAAFDANTILVSADRLYRSTDGGQRFTVVRTDRGANLSQRVVFLGTESTDTARWVCGNGSTIWTSTDTGATWGPHDF